MNEENKDNSVGLGFFLMAVLTIIIVIVTLSYMVFKNNQTEFSNTQGYMECYQITCKIINDEAYLFNVLLSQLKLYNESWNEVQNLSYLEDCEWNP